MGGCHSEALSLAARPVPNGNQAILHAQAEATEVGTQHAQSRDLPDVISVDPGDKHLPLVIIDE